MTQKSAYYAPISDTTRIHGSPTPPPPPPPGLGGRNTYTIILLLLDVGLIWVSVPTRVYSLKNFATTLRHLLFFSYCFFHLFYYFYRGQGTFIRFNFIALGNAIQLAAWSIMKGNWLARSYLRNAERLFPWRGIINKCGKAPPLSS